MPVTRVAPHSDIIVKDGRDTYFGRKICLAEGASYLILDCMITEGNPADVDLAIPMLDRQKQLCGRYPLKTCLDGGFAFKNNLNEAKAELRKIKDVCFAKKHDLKQPICAAVSKYTAACAASGPVLSPVSPC